MGKLAFNRLLNIQKCLLEIADLQMRTIAEQTLYTCGCGANEFNFRCGFALCRAKKYLRLPALAKSHRDNKFSQSDPVLIRQFKKNCSPIQS